MGVRTGVAAVRGQSPMKQRHPDLTLRFLGASPPFFVSQTPIRGTGAEEIVDAGHDIRCIETGAMTKWGRDTFPSRCAGATGAHGCFCTEDKLFL